ncbi:MAG: UDP-N-acetylglucosamine 1-carboxyvinyltransferase [Deltaproteobacteria bacterium]|nr:UDP-N-acetylglucosamine 1-carboxyvinyltransferase [Deltaproteobacteria bacterium]
MCKKISFDTNKKLNISKSRLEGSVAIGGAKNSALKLLTASILTDEDVTILNYPSRLFETRVHVEMLNLLGKPCRVTDDIIQIGTAGKLKDTLDWDGPSIRNTLLIFGTLLARKGRASVPLPGGCAIGERKYDLHQLILEKMGARVWTEGDRLYGEAPQGLHGAEIHLPLRSTGATENAILAGSLAKGTTVLWGPHVRPEILDLIEFMRSMGARIDIRGQESIHIDGVPELRGTKHVVLPDNMEAITYFIGAVITGGDIEIKNFPYSHLEVPLIHLRESGAKFYQGKDTVIVRGGQCYPVDISTGPYPGINSDMQPLFAVYAACAKGESRIIDLRFPKRFAYADELIKLNADVSSEDNILIVKGGRILSGNSVTALDLRCGAALVLAGLVSEGTTTILNANQIERGYQDIDKKLKDLGVKASFC